MLSFRCPVMIVTIQIIDFGPKTAFWGRKRGNLGWGHETACPAIKRTRFLTEVPMKLPDFWYTKSFWCLHHRAKSCKWLFPESIVLFKGWVSSNALRQNDSYYDRERRPKILPVPLHAAGQISQISFKWACFLCEDKGCCLCCCWRLWFMGFMVLVAKVFRLCAFALQEWVSCSENASAWSIKSESVSCQHATHLHIFTTGGGCYPFFEEKFHLCSSTLPKAKYKWSDLGLIK